MGNNLFVAGFPYESTEEELRALFATYGGIVSVKILTDRATGRSRGIAFILMSSEAEAQAALKNLNGATVGHRRIYVTEARPSEKPAAGGYTGPERRSGKDRRRSPPASFAASADWRPPQKKPWEKKPWTKDRKPGGFGSKKPWEKKPGQGEHKPWGKPGSGSHGDKKPWPKKSGPGKRQDFGGRKKWGPGGPDSGRKPGDFKSRPGGFKRKPGGGFRG